MKPSKYDSIASVFIIAGLLIWLIGLSDPTETILWRDASWIIGAAIGAYGLGLRQDNKDGAH